MIKRPFFPSVLLLLAFLVTISASAQGPAQPDVTLLNDDASGMTLVVTSPEYELSSDDVNGVACQRLHLIGSQASAPVQSLLLAAPPQASVNVQVEPLSSRKIALIAPLCASLIADDATTAGLASGNDALAQVTDLGFMRSQRILRLEVHPLQQDAGGRAVFYKRMRVTLHFEGDIAGEAISEPASFETIFQNLLVNYNSARLMRGAPAVTPPETRVWTLPSPAWRLLVNEPGIYSLGYDDLRNAGLPVDMLDPRTLKLFNFGKEVAITVTGEADSRLDQGDLLLFYGQGVDTRYTDANVYWLTYGGGFGLRMSERNSQSNTTMAATSYVTSVFDEENRFYLPGLPMEEGYDHWYGRRLDVYGPDAIRHLDYTLTVTDLAGDSHQSEIALSLGGNANARHHLRLYVNGQLVKDDVWQGRSVYTSSTSFPQNYLRSGSNTVRIEMLNDAPGQTLDQIYVDWIRLSYHRSFVAQNDILEFGSDQAGAWRYQLNGFTSSSLELYDTTDPFHVSRLIGWQAVNMGGGQYRLQFGDTSTISRKYLAQTQARRKKPLAISDKEPAKRPLTSSQNGADYLVIFHPDFGDAIKPLLDFRAAQGYRVMAVSTQDVYDEFGYGMMSAEAIRDFLAYAYANWQAPAPSFVLLVGDGTYDMRHYLPTSADTYLPPFLAMVDPTMGETATDNRFVAVAGDDILPDMHVGRLPANTPAEAAAMMDKILAYERTPVDAPWTQDILFVTDNLEGGGGNFYELSDAIADGYIDPPANTTKLIPENYKRTKLYLDRTCNSGQDCRQKMQHVLDDQGALFVSFIGHGTKTFWAREKIWDVTAASQMANGHKFPIMLPMTCNEGYFIEPALGQQSTSEAGVRLAENGAIASWAPTGYGLSSGHDYLERGFFLSVFHGFGHELGAAATAGKLYLAANAPSQSYLDLIDTFLLMGDPALSLPVGATPPNRQIFLPIVVKE